MNHIQLAAQHVMRVIPIEVLNIAFAESDWRSAPTSLMDRIITRVIRGRVLMDTNLVGGQYLKIDTSKLPYRRTPRGEVVIEVPPALIGGAEILSVSQIYNLTMGQQLGMLDGGIANGYVSQLAHDRHSGEAIGAANRLMDAVGNRPHISNARCDLVGTNTVLISDTYNTTQFYMLECWVTNDPNLNNISIRSNLNFRELVVRAVKSYIYTNLLVRLDQGYLAGGQESPSIKAYHESCADAEQLYDEYLRTKWAKTAAYSNREHHAFLIRSQISPGT